MHCVSIKGRFKPLSLIKIQRGARGVMVIGGAHGVIVIVAGCGHDDTSSNPGRA